MSIGTIILVGLWSQDRLVTLGYGSGVSVPPVPPVVTEREHWGHWPLVRKRTSTSSAFEEEEETEIAVAETVDEIPIEVPVLRTKPLNWDGVAFDALQKAQDKIKAETFVDIAARKEERRRAQEERQEEEDAMIAFLLLS